MTSLPSTSSELQEPTPKTRAEYVALAQSAMHQCRLLTSSMEEDARLNIREHLSRDLAISSAIMQSAQVYALLALSAPPDAPEPAETANEVVMQALLNSDKTWSDDTDRFGHHLITLVMPKAHYRRLLNLADPGGYPEPDIPTEADDPVFHTAPLTGSEAPLDTEIRLLREQAEAWQKLADSRMFGEAKIAYTDCAMVFRGHAERFTVALKMHEAAHEANLRELSEAMTEQTTKTLNLMKVLRDAPFIQQGEPNIRFVGRYDGWYEGTRRNALSAAEKTDTTAEGGS